jgi:transcriptional regulator with GAF, ATPase, and Fis domain
MKFTAKAVARAQFAVWIAKIRASKHDFVLAAPPTRRTGRTNSCHLLRRHRQQCGPRRAEQVHERYHLHRPGRSSRLLELQALRPRWRRSSWAPVPTSPIRRCRRHRGSLRAERWRRRCLDRPTVDVVKTLESEHIHETLAETDFNISEAARRLGMHRRTLALKLEKRRIH